MNRIGRWFHFNCQVISGKGIWIAFPNSVFTIDLTLATGNFSIGFSEADNPTLFDKKDGLIQVKIDTFIPGIIDKERENE